MPAIKTITTMTLAVMLGCGVLISPLGGTAQAQRHDTHRLDRPLPRFKLLCTRPVKTGWVCSRNKKMALSKAIAVWSSRYGSWSLAKDKWHRCNRYPSKVCCVVRARPCKRIRIH